MVRRIMLGAGLCAVALLAAGCAASDDKSGLSDWTAPEWMAEQAQAQEQFLPRLQACMDAKGWNVTMDADGGVVEPFSSEDEIMRAQADIDGCLVDQGIDLSRFESGNTEADLRAMYKMDVDIYECLLAHGVKLEQKPISEEKYVELGLAGADTELSETWDPYLDPTIMKLDQGEVDGLKRTCPDRWAFGSTR